MVCRKITEDHRPATHSRQSPVSDWLVSGQSPSPHFREIHLARQSPFYGPPGHIDSRDGVNLCPSSVANPSRQHSRAHPLARWFAGRSPTCHTRPCRPCIPLSCKSPDKAIAILRACRAHPLARWHRFVSIERPEPFQTALQGTSAHAMVCRKITDLPRTPCRPCIPLSCNSSDKAIAILRTSRAHPLARWHQFVSIERPKPLQTALQGISARAMVCRKIIDLPPTGNTQPSEPVPDFS